ncbi:MAG TPA: LuxR C-terminal-related transcriptional regulator [Novosphingobium sp.]|nr:LuxR C-terminal-related transcriptional regulator [Novosphingobium sp.]
MGRRRNLALVDRNFRRRAAICHCLAGSNIHVEPFEDVAEVRLHWPRSGVVLVEDAGGNLRELLDHMATHCCWLPLIGLAEFPDTTGVVRAILEGAVDYLAWPCSAAEIAQAVAGAEASEGTIGTHKLREARARSRVQRLTKREREVLAGVAGGLSNRLIGAQLEISPRTVEIHRANMLNKIGAQHTSDAIRIAIEASLVA